MPLLHLFPNGIQASWKHRHDYYRQSNGTVSTGVMFRLAGFSLISILSVASCGVYLLSSGESKNFDYVIIYTAIVSNADVPLVGLNRSIIRTWMFWKKDDGHKIKVASVDV